MNICVFCSSSDNLPEDYYSMADTLGSLIAKGGHALVYGGGKIGLMGTVSRSVKSNGGNVTGVIPERLNRTGIVSEDDNKTIVTADMKERKAEMHRLSDAFVTLPGGFGTLEELLEIITLKQLKYHTKPIVIINTNGFYNSMLELFERIFSERFAKAEYSKFYFVVTKPEDAINYIEGYTYENVPDKFGL